MVEKSSFSIFFEKAKHHGLIWAIRRIFLNILSKVFQYDDMTLVLYEVSIKLMPKVAPKIDGVIFAWVTEQEREKILGLRDAQLSNELVEYYFKNNGRCLGAFLNGRLIGYSWMYTRSFHFMSFDYVLKLKNNECYCGIQYVLPEYRGMLLQPAMLSELSRLMLAENYDTGYGSAMKDNLSSHRGIVKAGPKPYYSLRVKKLFKKVISRTETAVR